MSNSLAIAAVTAALHDLLQGVTTSQPGDPDAELGNARVTTRPPGKARKDQDDPSFSQLNLFLYQTQQNGALRNLEPRDLRPGESGAPALALDLFYLLTAYGKDGEDLLAHRLLGRAMMLLHDNALLPRGLLEQALRGSDLHRQIERVRIKPHPLTVEELGKLWGTFQVPYSISVAYEVSVVLLDSTHASRTPLPVLRRAGLDPSGGSAEQGAVRLGVLPPFPEVLEVRPPDRQPAVRLGVEDASPRLEPDVLELLGHDLRGDRLEVRLSHASLPQFLTITSGIDATAAGLRVALPILPAAQMPPAGIYAVTVTRADPSGGPLRTSAAVPVALAPRPRIESSASGALELSVSPPVFPGQRVALLLSDRVVVPESLPGPADPPSGRLSFRFAPLPRGEYFARLRVDGVDSLIIDSRGSTPVFDDRLKVTVT